MNEKLDEMDEATRQAKADREAYLENLKREGDKMAAKLGKKFGMDVTFEVKPSRLTRSTRSG